MRIQIDGKEQLEINTGMVGDKQPPIYIYLHETLKISRTETVSDSPLINVDYSQDDMIVGIEIVL
jgi:hypothetical protein